MYLSFTQRLNNRLLIITLPGFLDVKISDSAANAKRYRKSYFEKGAKYSYQGKNHQTVYKERHVDFNQGIDARLLTEEKIKLLAKIEINPLRIAFDHIKYKQLYSSRIDLAAKYNMSHLSNYILYKSSIFSPSFLRSISLFFLMSFF